jgi:DNA-binding MarR family transcriptional regulator
MAMPTSFENRPPPEDLKQVLAGTPTIKNGCALDLLAFLHRHPRTLLTIEQLAGFVGYNIEAVAKALDAFAEAGLLRRMAPPSMHSARMFLLLLDDPQRGPIRALLELACSREGRRAVLEALNAPELGPEPGAAPGL